MTRPLIKMNIDKSISPVLELFLPPTFFQACPVPFTGGGDKRNASDLSSSPGYGDSFWKIHSAGQ